MTDFKKIEVAEKLFKNPASCKMSHGVVLYFPNGIVLFNDIPHLT